MSRRALGNEVRDGERSACGDLKGLGKESGFTPTEMGRRIKQGSVTPERLGVLSPWSLWRTLRITALHLKDLMIFWEKN